MSRATTKHDATAMQNGTAMQESKTVHAFWVGWMTYSVSHVSWDMTSPVLEAHGNWQMTKLGRKWGKKEVRAMTTDTIALRMLYTNLNMMVRCRFKHSCSKRSNELERSHFSFCDWILIHIGNYLMPPTYNITPPTQTTEKKSLNWKDQSCSSLRCSLQTL